ncbi:MAG: hypothetical protein ACJ79S_20030 [Gemmatimonadaceae bacterium]
MPRTLLLALPAALVYGAVAAGVARMAGTRWAWVAGVALVLGVALLGASRVGTANPLSRTARWDPLLFFVMTTALLSAPALAAAWAATSSVAATSAGAPGDTIRAALWSALVFLLTLPVGFVAAVAVEVLWPH